MKGILRKLLNLSQNGVKRAKNQETFSHCAKFSQVLNFRTLLRNFFFPAFSAFLSFLFLICNAKFDSNSTCLDRLDKFGINRLQKLQN